MCSLRKHKNSWHFLLIFFLLRQDLIQPQLASNSLYAAEDDFELLVLRSAGITVYTPHLVFAMLGIKLGASCMSGKGSTD